MPPQQILRNIDKKKSPITQNDMLPSVRTLLDRCLAYDPAKRPTAADLCEMVFSLDLKTMAVISRQRLQGFEAQRASVHNLLQDDNSGLVHQGVTEGFKLVDSILGDMCVARTGKPGGHGIGQHLSALKKFDMLPAELEKEISKHVVGKRNMEAHEGGIKFEAVHGHRNLDIVDQLLAMISPEPEAAGNATEVPDALSETDGMSSCLSASSANMSTLSDADSQTASLTTELEGCILKLDRTTARTFAEGVAALKSLLTCARPQLSLSRHISPY